jgi:hypothetical protein
LAPVLRRHRIHVRVGDGELARLDELRGSRSRPEFMRALLRAAGPLEPEDPPSHSEAIALLRESAFAGSIGARVALERATRSDRRELPRDVELERLLGDG